MITAYEVGAVLRIIDEASPVLQRMAAAAREFDGLILKAKESLSDFASTRLAGLLERLGNVDQGLGKIGETSATLPKVFAENFAKIDASIDTAVGSARNLGIALADVAAASKTIAIPAPPMRTARMVGEDVASGGAPPGIRRRGSESAGFGRIGAGREGITGPYWSMPSGPITATAAAVAYGAYLDAQMEDAIFQIEYHLGTKNTPENNAKYRKIIQDTMSITGSTLASVVEATKQEVRMFKGTPGGGIDVLPEMLRAAAVEAKLKGTSLEESMTALIGLAHMTKEYTPEQIKKLAPAFAFLSAANPASLGGIERAASYAVPILQSGLEIDPIQTLLLGTAMTRAGATNTKSGTWLRNMALAAMPGTSLMSKIAFKKHEEALTALGLVDESGAPTWFTEGKPDLIKMLDIASQHAADIPLTKRAAYEKQLFGTQGFGGFALLGDPAVKQQIAALKAEMNSPEFMNRYQNFMQDYAGQSPLQMGRQTWADLQTALMDLGKTIMPSVITGIKEFDKAIKTSEEQVKWFSTQFKPAIDAVQGFANAVLAVMNFLANPKLAPLPVLPPGGPDLGAPDRLNLFRRLNPTGGLGGAIAPPNAVPNVPGTGVGPMGFIAPPGTQTQGGFAIPPGAGAQPQTTMTPIHVKTALYLDGRIIAQAMSSQIARLTTYPGQAPQGDSYADWVAPDYNFATG